MSASVALVSATHKQQQQRIQVRKVGWTFAWSAMGNVCAKVSSLSRCVLSNGQRAAVARAVDAGGDTGESRLLTLAQAQMNCSVLAYSWRQEKLTFAAPVCTFSRSWFCNVIVGRRPFAAPLATACSDLLSVRARSADWPASHQLEGCERDATGDY